MRKIVQEFKVFAIKGNVVDMGVGVVIGAAITALVQSLVKDIFTPIVSLFTVGINSANWFVVLKVGNKGGPYHSLHQAQADAAITMNIGNLFNAVLSFFIVTLILFFIIRGINRLRHLANTSTDPLSDTRECPYCCTVIPSRATRCPSCTSQLKAET